MIWSSIVTFREPQRATIPSPHPPGGNPARGAGELDDRRAGDRRRYFAARQLELGALADVGGAHRDELDLAVALREPVLLFVRAVERFRQVLLQRHRQLERLAGVAQVRFAFARQLAGVGERDEIRAHRVSALVGRDEAERGQDARDLGDEHRADPELVRELARVQRPGAAERDEREVGRIVPALDRDNSQRAQHLRVDDVDDRRRDRSRQAHARPPRGRARRRRRAAPAAGRAAGSRR